MVQSSTLVFFVDVSARGCTVPRTTIVTGPMYFKQGFVPILHPGYSRPCKGWVGPSDIQYVPEWF